MGAGHSAFRRMSAFVAALALIAVSFPLVAEEDPLAAEDPFAGEAVTDDFDLDSLFDDPSALAIDEGETVENPEASLFADQAFSWSGDFTGKAGVIAGWEELPPDTEDLNDPDEALIADLAVRLWFDARPDRNFRVFGKFTTGWPFSASTAVDDPSSPTGTGIVTVPNIGVFELFSDFNWNDRVFFRFGKQTSGWGLSRFYQIGDPLSVAVKDPEDPSADLEGPVALRVSVPLGVNTVYLWSALKDSYLPSDGSAASVSDLGFGAKGDFLVSVPKNPIMSNGELSLGAWYQKRLAPRAVAGYSTAFGDFQVFTDQLVTWGLDSARIADGETVEWDPDGPGTAVAISVAETEKPDTGLFWSATLGSMYVNNDWHFTAYGEYLYSGVGSGDEEIYALWAERFELESAGIFPVTLTVGDMYGYLSRHNSALSLSWSELFGNDKLGFSALWLQDWVDRSGMANAKLTLSPFDHFAVEGGLTVSWGGTGDEWILKTGNPETGAPVRTAASLAFTLGGGKF